ncbi:MAG: membrane protein insertase YidC, partial [Chitinispirillales bacterium]|nr:membrane protein insertase YidC [Chitinispirillales bacterium]
MNKNSLIAILLIALTVILFNSAQWNKFWYGTILKKPVPAVTPPSQRAAAKEAAAKDTAEIKVLLPDEKPGEGGTPAPAAAGAGGAKIEGAGEAEADSAALAAQIVEDTVIVETNRIIAAISTKGGRIVSLKAKDYKYAVGPRKDQTIDLLPRNSLGGAQLSVNNESFDDRFFDAAVSPDGYTVALEAKSASGRLVRKVFTFADDAYKIGYAVSGDGIAGQKVTLGWAGGIEDSEATPDVPFGGEMDRRRAHYSDGRTVNHLEMKKKGVEEPSGAFRWVGMSSKYFFAAIVADTLYDADIRVEGRGASGKPSSGKGKKTQDIDYSVYYQSEAKADSVAAWIYAGPSKVGELSQYRIKLDKTLFPVLSWARYIFWADLWFPPIAEIILKLLLYLHKLFKDYGIAILLLTLLSKVVTFPLTQSSNKSMTRMRDLQPKVAALRQKHGKANPQKFNEEMMALYKAEGVNPFNPGCLPMFLQMP